MAINALSPNKDANKCNIAISQLFVIAAGLTCGSLASMDWKFTWRQENYILIIYAVLGWGLLHIVPFVPFLKDLFAMADQSSTVIFTMILITDVAIVLTVWFERAVVIRMAEQYVDLAIRKEEPNTQ